MVEIQKSKPAGRVAKRAFWQSHMEGWKGSGQSKQAYCREHGLNSASFYRWHGKLVDGESKGPRFVSVHLPVAPSNGYAVEITLGNGRLVRIGRDADPVWVAHLVRALEAPC